MFKTLLTLAVVLGSFNAYSSGCYNYYLNIETDNNGVVSRTTLTNDQITADNIRNANGSYFCAAIKVIGTDDPKCIQNATNDDAVVYLGVSRSEVLKEAFAGKNGEEVQLVCNTRAPASVELNTYANDGVTLKSFVNIVPCPSKN
jgi:hypothetical protein